MTSSSLEPHIKEMLNLIDFFLNQIAADEEVNLDALTPMMLTLERILVPSSCLVSPLLQDLHLKLELLTKTLQKEQQMIKEELESLNHHSQGISRYISTQHLSSS